MAHVVPHYDKIDQWLDWGDHTVSIDPIGNSAWIHEGGDGKHKESVDRGRHYDSKDVQHLRELLGRDNHGPPYQLFVPTFNDLAKVPKFESHCTDTSFDMWRGKARDVRGVGELPVIRAQHVNGDLPDVDKGLIEKQIFANRHTVYSKALSKAGVPDHGLPTYGSC